MSSSDLSDDEYEYETYAMDFYEDLDGPPLIKKKSRLIAAAVQNNADILRDLLDSPKWYKVRDKYGYSLLQITILRENIQAFDYLLSIEDFPLEQLDKQGETAIVTALSGYISNDIWMCDHFAYELIKKGVRLDRACFDGYSLLHFALERNFLRVAKLLVERGVDLNAQNNEGNTPLHSCFYCDDANLVEAVLMLLVNGADPTICDSRGFTPFDLVVNHYRASTVHAVETLFYYTFDQHTQYSIKAGVLLKAAEAKLSFFEQLVERVVEVCPHDEIGYYCRVLLTIDGKYLKILVDKFDYLIKEVFQSHNRFVYFDLNNLSCENFNKFLENDKLRGDVIDFIANMDSSYLIDTLLKNQITESSVTELVCYLLSYGMTLNEIDLEAIYNKFGYCQLFKMCLSMDVNKQIDQRIQAVIPRLLCDFSIDLQSYIEDPKECLSEDLMQLLGYCAHPRIRDYALSLADDELSDRVRDLPQVPLLVELARNVFRRYFVKKLGIKSCKEFYSLLKLLCISPVHERIITLETKLY